MAGNIVKWWKHKILGGYKQFTVLQECATDSEELIYPGRAPSACSAPPDLLLTSDREQMLKVKSSSSSSAGAGTGQTKASMHHHHQQQQQQQQQQQHHHHHHHPHHNGSGHHHQSAANGQHHQHHKSQKDAFRKCSGKAAAAAAAAAASGSGGAGATNTLNTTAATIRSDPDRVRLEEFTCDVSLEDGKKPQPLQFSFTLYDLDGHGKITKDDIAGIVSTIYESIGKSVVVPHYGSKTINVRLTVSPDGKTPSAPKSAAVKKAIITPRRRGYRSRKLLSDDDGSDTSENCPRMLLRHRNGAASTNNNNTAIVAPTTANNLTQSQQQALHHHHHHHTANAAQPQERKLKESNLSKAAALATAANQQSTGLSKSSEATITTTSPPERVEASFHDNNLSPTTTTPTVKGLNNAISPVPGAKQQSENVYESIPGNLGKCCSNLLTATPNGAPLPSVVVGSGGLNASTASTLICRDCIDGGPMVATVSPGCHLESTATTAASPAPLVDAAMVIPTLAANAASRSKRKLVRKTRSSRKVVTAAGKLPVEDFGGRPRARSLSVGNENCYENVIGRVAAAPGECWKSSLCRRELIEIIRESMVKNSLCFQPNRKATESSPKHRHRSHTIASRVGDQVFLNYHHHPALLAAGGGPTALPVELAASTQINGSAALVSMVAATAGHEANLCGYDSYLHQTICAAANGGNAATIHLAAAAAHTVQPLATVTPNRMLHQQHHHHSKAKRKEQHRMMALAATTGGVAATTTAAATATNHPTPVKLSTALLNQQYPNLSAEQKLTRSINQVEQWLDHRSPKGAAAGLVPSKVKLADDSAVRTGFRAAGLKRSKSKEELTGGGDLLLLENLKLSEDIAEIAVVTPKKVYNKESLIASANIKKNIKTHHAHHQARTAEGKGGKPTGDQLVQLQYGSVPVNAEPSECENLIHMSDGDGEDETTHHSPSSPAPQQLAPSVRHQQQQQQQQQRHHAQSQSQPQSPQHHQQRVYCGAATASPAGGGAHSVSSASAASTTAVHRYVHEHIHHHYHHFENDPDES